MLLLSLSFCRHLQGRKTIGPNLVSLSCCHRECVSSANQQLYLWPAEENLGDPISCTHTRTWYLQSAHKMHKPLMHQTFYCTHAFIRLGWCALFLPQAGAAVHRCPHADILCMYVIFSIHSSIYAQVRHTHTVLYIHTQTHIHTHTPRDSQQAKIVTMTSGSAVKTETGEEYSLSFDGAQLNFRDSFL